MFGINLKNLSTNRKTSKTLAELQVHGSSVDESEEYYSIKKYDLDLSTNHMLAINTVPVFNNSFERFKMFGRFDVVRKLFQVFGPNVFKFSLPNAN